jgi:hypothetical protein
MSAGTRWAWQQNWLASCRNDEKQAASLEVVAITAALPKRKCTGYKLVPAGASFPFMIYFSKPVTIGFP